MANQISRNFFRKMWHFIKRYDTIENKLHKNCITYNKREIVKVED